MVGGKTNCHERKKVQMLGSQGVLVHRILQEISTWVLGTG
jgi:hypothetical protein